MLLFGLSLTVIIFLILIVILLPLIFTIIVGISIADMLGFTGIKWWISIILFYVIISSVLGAIIL